MVISDEIRGQLRGNADNHSIGGGGSVTKYFDAENYKTELY